MEQAVILQERSLRQRVKTMLRVDFRRMLHARLLYILLACALLIPIVMTVMLTAMDGQETVNQQTGEITVMQGPENAWQMLGALPGAEHAATGEMDVLSMCNINMMFLAAAVFVCLFISVDFRSGYAKNLFAVRARKGEYVISKTLAGFAGGAMMLLCYFIGAMLGAAVSGLSFDLGGLSAGNIMMCMLAKIFLMLVFVSIFVLISVAAKQTAWLSLCGSLGGGMLLFMMASAVTPLASTLMNVILCLAGGVLFAGGLGVFSRLVLEKTSLV